MKWFRKHRPNVHYWLWTSMMVINLLMAVLCSWVAHKYEASMTLDISLFVGISILAFVMTRIWQHWIDNPEDYEKLHTARLRGLRGRMGRDRRRRKDKEKGPKE